LQNFIILLVTLQVSMHTKVFTQVVTELIKKKKSFLIEATED